VPGVYIDYLAEQEDVGGRNLGEPTDAVLRSAMPGRGLSKKELS
jgi:hypothetical protein